MRHSLNNNELRERGEKELEKRRGRSKTYTEPLIGSTLLEDQDIQSFLCEFYSLTIFHRGPEMQSLLSNQTVVATHYANLVPHVVSFDQFWSRYFYRCSLTTILQEFEQDKQQTKSWRQRLNGSLSKFKENRDARALENTRSCDAAQQQQSSSLEEKLASRIQLFDDITETIPEEEDDEHVAIGFASAG